MGPVIILSNANIKQHFWRERQLDIFYRTGRPIYNIDFNNQHLRSHNNPTVYRDANCDFWRPAFCTFRIKQ
jgi:hypothetical protein